MKSVLALAAALTLAAAGAPALAQDAAACNAPKAPVIPDGATATTEQLVAAKTAVGEFMTASDAYQDCEVKALEAQRSAAKAAKTKFDESIAKAASERVGANQKDKEAVGAGFNAAVRAYKAAHPA